MLEWLFANKHLMPSMALFLIGLLMVLKVPVSYALKTRSILNLFNPGKAVMEDASAKKQLIVGIILFVVGLGSQVLITRYYGYYFVVRGMPVFVH